MVEELVIDASVLVAAFLEHNKDHTEADQHLRHLDAGDYRVHLPLLALLETCAAVNRKVRSDPYALALRVKTSLQKWAEDGKVVFYPLDDGQAQLSLNTALRDRLSGSDSTYAALAEHRGIRLISFDGDHLTRFQGKASR